MQMHAGVHVNGTTRDGREPVYILTREESAALDRDIAEHLAQIGRQWADDVRAEQAARAARGVTR
ncbi:hypothetical protein [Streptomyces sp. enrichment culture]|uniref:hypothetical protein n=1 Tax=Streptomyces sp. enrichment culture TaxID=1795815 RepID=UPI003F54B21E